MEVSDKRFWKWERIKSKESSYWLESMKYLICNNSFVTNSTSFFQWLDEFVKIEILL